MRGVDRAMATRASRAELLGDRNMKRLWLLGATVLTSFTLGGCPLYPDEAQCSYNSDCSDGYVCDYPSGACVLPERTAECTNPNQCGVNESCGADLRCHPGDCSFVGCPAGFSCIRSGMRFSCEDTLSGSGGSGAAGGSAGATNGGAAGEGGTSGGTAGSSAGGTTSGGAAGASTGGSATGGSATGGSATGGSATGGASTGGSATGGASTGGASTGGSASGGASTGGASSGGAATGGTGGAAAGGASSGGAATGGTSGAATGGAAGSST